MADPQAKDPRRAALALLGDVTGRHRLLSEALPKRLAGLAAADRARAQRLATTTLRAMDRADRMLGPWLKRRPPARVMNILRLGVVEICEEGEAPHGVVNAAVAMARGDRRHAAAAGLVNAVLRKVAAEAAKWSTLPVPRLPKWLRKPLIADFGKPAVEAMEAAHFAGAPLDLTAKTDPARVAADTGGVVLPTGSVRLRDWRQVSALPGYAAGDWWVQDAAAALPARLLAPEPGARVLDMCAAPGGKTLQLAAMGARVTALDLSARRLERLEENLARTGLAAEVVAADALEYEAPAFDAILLDAPCSATGTIRRHPDLPHAKDGSDFPALFELQARLIDRALALLKPGGRLVYCTCSLLIDEGEEQVRDAVARHPGLTTTPVDLPGIDRALRTGEGGLRLTPATLAEAGGMDGFYMAALVKPA
ncbi:MAG TPA: methyltransferase domain-containing protein [Aliiroseovarius sp.]|nr:methyltransferase domain-containing protein [Aliiroseovarius sp.]